MTGLCAVRFPMGLGSINTLNASVQLVQSRQEIQALLEKATALSDRTRAFLAHLKISTYLGYTVKALERQVTTLEGMAAITAAKAAQIAGSALACSIGHLQTLCGTMRSDIEQIHQIRPVFQLLHEIEAKLLKLCLASKNQDPKTLFAAVKEQCIELRSLFARARPAVEAVKSLSLTAHPRTELETLFALFEDIEACLVSQKILSSLLTA